MFKWHMLRGRQLVPEPKRGYFLLCERWWPSSGDQEHYRDRCGEIANKSTKVARQLDRFYSTEISLALADKYVKV